MQTVLSQARRYLGLAIVVTGLVVGIGACSSGAPAPAAPAASAGAAVAAAPEKVNTKIAPADYQSKFGSGSEHILIDVRTPEEFASGHIPGSVNIPVDSLGQRLSEVPQDKPVVVYCRSGNRSNQAAQILDQAGYSQIYDLGGIVTWQQQGFPVQ
ncbi:MAG TPA: rhodanese-like domain-containing protein [Caldilinea sp.]|nr:rhodanese-like domain-containing protein [Caldilinea sp.]